MGGERIFQGCPCLADENGFVIVNNTLYEYLGKNIVVSIPDGVTRIGEGAFDGRVQLKELHIPNSVSCIGKNAFDGRCNLTIFASVDSFAKEYAEQNGIDFIFE